jgi:hypothetical protein
MIGNIFFTIVIIIVGLLVSYIIVQLVSKFINENPKGFNAYKKKVQDDVSKGINSIAEKAKYQYYGHHYDPSKANLDFQNAKPLALKLYKCLSRFQVYGESAVIISKEIATLLDKLNVPKNEKDTIISIGITVSAGETLRDKFNRIDRDSNDVITIDEMSHLFLPSKSERIILEACGMPFYQNWGKIGVLIKQAMKVADLNKDSKIDFNEFRALYIIKLLEFYQRLNPNFDSEKAIKK